MNTAPIKIKFADFWTEDIDEIFLYGFLKKYFRLELSDDPEVLVYSVFGNDHLNYNCKKIFFTSENKLPDYRFCDYSIGFNYDENNSRHLRYPLYLFYDDINQLIKKEPVTIDILKDKSNFCVFIVSNPGPEERKIFFKQLDSVKHVDSAGSVLNNMPGKWQVPRGTKYHFLNKYRFTIAFENNSSPGYLTEKIYEPMHSRSIPIYWGDPLVHLDFNQGSYINVSDFKNYDEAIKYILEVENNTDLYLKILNEPYLHNNVVPEHLKEDRLYEFFERIFFKESIKPVSKQPAYIYNKMQMILRDAYNKIGNKMRTITKTK